MIDACVVAVCAARINKYPSDLVVSQTSIRLYPSSR